LQKYGSYKIAVDDQSLVCPMSKFVLYLNWLLNS